VSDPAFFYTAYGLLIRSPRALPLPPCADLAPDVEPDVVLEAGTTSELSDAPLDWDDPAIVASYDLPDSRWYVAVADADGYRLTFRDSGEFLISGDFTSIRWIENGARADLMPILFAGTVLAFYLTMRHQLVLHASAVARGEWALAFVGQSGRGKSTLAALAAVAGARVITDDVLLVDVEGTPRCRGSAGELRLRDGAASIAAAVPTAERRATADERIGLVCADVEPDWVNLGAVVIPYPSRESDEIEVVTVPPSDAVFRLLAFPRVHGLRSPIVLRRQFEMLSELLRRVPVYEVIVPWGPPYGATLADQLLDLAEPPGRDRALR
jgi:hypothetical protein